MSQLVGPFQGNPPAATLEATLRNGLLVMGGETEPYILDPCDISFHNASYGRTIALSASYAPTIGLAVQYSPTMRLIAGDDPTVELRGSC